MKIECPHCFKENTLNLEGRVDCEHCQEDLANNSYKKPIFSGGTVLVIGILGGQIADYAIFDNRYPLKVEYSLIDTCLNSSDTALNRILYKKKREVCICSMQETMNEISYIRYKVDDKGFFSAFEANLKQCLGQKN